jgi:hypothetical protein
MIIERLKFYGDGNGYRNKLFCYTINSLVYLPERLKYFAKLYYLRAAWYECKEDGYVIANTQIDLLQFYSECDSPVFLLEPCVCGSYHFINNNGTYICSECSHPSKHTF